MDVEELRRAVAKAGIKCGDATLLSQLADAAGAQGLAPKDVAAKLNAALINE